VSGEYCECWEQGKRITVQVVDTSSDVVEEHEKDSDNAISDFVDFKEDAP